MIVIPLDKLSPDGYKQPANIEGEITITHARLYYDDFIAAHYIQGVMVDGAEASFEFDNTGIAFSVFKCFTSIDSGVSYVLNKSYSGTQGNDEPVPGLALDPDDYGNLQIPVKTTADDGFVPMSASEWLEDSGIDTGTVNYLYTRAFLSQYNGVDSSKVFVGTVFIEVDPDTGDILSRSKSVLSYSTTMGSAISVTQSAKISTGFYYLQCKSSGNVNGFVDEIASAPGGTGPLFFENKVYPVTRKHTITENLGIFELEYTTELKGYLVLCPDSEDVESYFDTGKLAIKTYNTSWVLTDNIIEDGVMIELRWHNLIT